MELRKESLPGYVLSDDPARIDLERVHGWLVTAYWCEGIPREIVARAVAHSLVLGIYGPGGQVAFARLVTDRATFAWLCDVIVAEEARGQGMGKWLVEATLVHPDLQGLRRLLLATRTAHGLYRGYGFSPLRAPENWMEINEPDLYLRGGA